MSPGEVVKTGELNVYQGQLFHVGFLCASPVHPLFAISGAQTAHAKLIRWVQLADRKPFAGGPLDPRLVGPFQHEWLISIAHAAATELDTTIAGHKQQVSTVSNMWPEAGRLHWTLWYVAHWKQQLSVSV